MKQISVGVQLFTLRDECQKDMCGTLRKVKELGFQGVELAGYGNLTISELKEELGNLGLEITSAHVGIDDLENNIEKVIEEHKFLGNKFVVCPCIDDEKKTAKGYGEVIVTLKEASKKLASEGITLLYHNHDFELENIVGNQCAMEAILANGNVDAEFDVFWLTFAGHNPVDWLKRYSGRVPIVHLKDMTIDGTRSFAEIGTGGVDINGILDVGEEVGVEWYIVEQDECQTFPFECIETSMKFLKTKLPDLA